MMNTFLPFFFNNFSVTILFICYSVTYSETLFFFFDVKLISYLCIIKLLQKSEMRKEIVIELSYKGFSRASDYS